MSGEKVVKVFGEEINVNARIEYIEGYSGHADQEWLLNFVYSFINKPKHIFLVHGEAAGQEVLREKIIEETNIPVSIPDYGEKYELGNSVTMVEKIELIDKGRQMRLETKDRLGIIEQEFTEMMSMIKEDLSKVETTDEDIFRIKERIKELEQYIVRVIE